MTRRKSSKKSPAAIIQRLNPATRGGTVTALLGLALSMMMPIADAGEPSAAANENRAGARPSGYIYGGALGLRREVYADYDLRVVPLPVIGYRGENLQVYGPFISYTVFRHGGLSFDAKLSPRFQGYDDSDSDIFEGMEEREFSMDFGFGMKLERNAWKFELAALRDILNRSDGHEITARFGRAFRAGSLSVEPAIGLSYLDRRHVDYYYGVDESEAASFRPAYRGDSALNTSASLDFVTPAWFGGLTRIGIENIWFDDEIADSPLTDTDTSLGVFISFSKFFDA